MLQFMCRRFLSSIFAALISFSAHFGLRNIETSSVFSFLRKDRRFFDASCSCAGHLQIFKEEFP